MTALATSGIDAAAFTYRGNRYGVSWLPTWPHVSLGVSAHLSTRFGHVSLHLPVGCIVIGCIGASDASEESHINPSERRRLIAVRVDTARRAAERRAA